MTKPQTTMALRITGETLNKIMHLDYGILDLPLRDLWNHVYVKDFPGPGRKEGRCIMTASTFYETFRWVDGRQPRYNFAAVVKLNSNDRKGRS
jgi:hypothetical protein